MFEDYDLIVCPTSPFVAFRLGEKTDDPLENSLSDVYTIPANIAGLPALSVPCGFAEGLPVGLQFIGKPLQRTRFLERPTHMSRIQGFTQRTRRLKEALCNEL